MTWPAILYLVVVIAFGIYSAYDDIRDRVGAWYILVDGAVTLSWTYFLLAYYYPGIVLAAPVLLALLAFAIVWTIFDVRRELQGIWHQRDLSYDPELSPELNRRVDRGVEAFGVGFGVLLGAPALLAAIAVVRRVL